MNERFVTIAGFGDLLEAELARDKLESEGLNCLLLEDATQNLYGYASGAIKLQVRQSDMERAQQILEIEE